MSLVPIGSAFYEQVTLVKGNLLHGRMKDVTVLHAVPALMAQLFDSLAEDVNDKGLSRLRTVLTGGDYVPVSLLEKIRRQLPWQEIRVLYGPTEASIICAHTEDFRGGAHLYVRSPIGRPIANTQIYILDGHREPVPVGVAGELYIGGAGVARGYLNRPELTAERFLRDPFVEDPQARMYRTGDLGRWLPDGNIEFLGRNDFQVKVRGFRIELGEIESRLREHAGVGEAAVIAREDVPGDKRLVAYYTGDALLDLVQLRSHLSARLPEYMVPAAYVHLEALPLTANGKLDRKALPAPDGDAYAVRGYEAPVGETETALAAVWSELLGVERVGRHDNFFELGGHSLLAVRVISRLRQALGIETAIREIFSSPVLADLAAALEATASPSELPAVTVAARKEPIPLSFAQRRLWFLAQMEGVSEADHISAGLRLRGRLDKAALRRSLDRIVARHEALRTTFVVVDEQPVQRIAAVEASHFDLLEHDLGGDADPSAALQRLVIEESGACFDLESGPLIRGRLLHLNASEHVLLITLHHIVSDGWSLGILFGELSVLYQAYAHGQGDPLPELPVQYADYSLWQRRWIEGEILQRQAEYWKQALRGSPVLLELPLDHVRPVQQDHAGAVAGVV
jgi:acyl carrier protein